MTRNGERGREGERQSIHVQVKLYNVHVYTFNLNSSPINLIFPNDLLRALFSHSLSSASLIFLSSYNNKELKMHCNNH